MTYKAIPSLYNTSSKPVDVVLSSQRLLPTLVKTGSKGLELPLTNALPQFITLVRLKNTSCVVSNVLGAVQCHTTKN